MTNEELVKIFAKDKCFIYTPSKLGEKIIFASCLPEVARPLMEGLKTNQEIYLEAVVFTKFYNDCFIRIALPKFIDIKHYGWQTLDNCTIYKDTSSTNLLFNEYVVACSPTTMIFDRLRRYLKFYIEFLEKSRSVFI